MTSADTKRTEDTISLVVVDPNEVIFEDEVKKIMVPTPTQEIAILPQHTPLYAQLVKGDIEITTKKDKKIKIAIESGIIRVKMNKVSIVVGF